MSWRDHLIDTHVAAPHDGHVPSGGNTSQEPSGPQGLPCWLIQKFAAKAAVKRTERALAEQAACRLRKVESHGLADDFLRSKGHFIKRIR